MADRNERPETALQTARERLKEEKPDDYRLAPTAHAADYGKDIPKLAELLRTDALQAIAEAYETADLRALERQSKFRTYGSWANRLIAVTAVTGALMTAAVTLSPEPGGGAQTALVPILSVFAAFTAGAAAFLMNRLKGGRYLGRWMAARAKAESERLAYFTLVTRPHKLIEGTSDPDVYLVSFWYFLRHQYYVQKKYYNDRGRDHESAAERGLTMAAAAVALGMISALLVPALFTILGAWVALFGVVTVFGTALGSFASLREAMNQDQRNAERYERTGDILTKLGMRIGEVEAAISRGKFALLADFVDAVHEQLSLEHRQWLETAEGSSAVLQKLDEALKAETGSPQET